MCDDKGTVRKYSIYQLRKQWPLTSARLLSFGEVRKFELARRQLHSRIWIWMDPTICRTYIARRKRRFSRTDRQSEDFDEDISMP